MGLSVCLPCQVFVPARASASTVVMDQPRSALSLRIFSMLTSAAPGSTCTSSSGNFFLMTSAVAAAIGVQVPPVGPAEKMRLAFCWATAGAARHAPARNITAANTLRVRNGVMSGVSLRAPRSGPERNDLSRGVEAERACLAYDFEIRALLDVWEEGLGALDLPDHERILDPDDPRPFGRREPDAAERVVHGVAVRVEDERQLGAVRSAGGQAIDGRLLPVDLLREPSRREIRVADAGGVAAAVLGQVERDDPEDLRIVREGLVRVRRAPDDVGVHAGAGDVLADLLHHEHVDRREWQPRHPLARNLEQPPLPGLEVFRVEGLDPGGLVIAVLDDAEPEADPRLGQHFAPDRGDDGLVAVVDVGAVVLGGALVLTQPDGHHLEEARLDGALEVRVRLDAVDDAYPVGLEGYPVAPDGQPECLEMVHHGADDDRDVGDTATARFYSHGAAALDGQPGLAHGDPHPGRDVGQALPGKGLPHPVHQGQRHGRMILRPPGPVNDLDFGGFCP